MKAMPNQTIDWNEEEVALLVKLVNEGLSASEIAKEFGGVTRNTIQGKCNRLGLHLQGGRTGGAAHASFRVKPQMLFPRPKRAPAQERLSIEDRRVICERLKLPKTDDPLGPRGCRWPIGDPQERGFRFCQRERHGKSSWCPEHDALGHEAGRVRAER